MKVVQVSTQIQAPLQFVFDRFVDFDTSARVLHKATRVDFRSANRTGLGTEWEQEEPNEGSKPTIVLHRVVAFDPPNRFVMTAEAKSSFETMTFQFVDSGSKTDVTFTVEVSARGLASKILTTFLGGMIKGFMQEDLDRMKDYIEKECGKPTSD